MKSIDFRTDPLFLRNQFQGDGIFAMPLIKKTAFDLKKVELIGYDKTKAKDKANQNKFVHFFLDDYKFGALYNDPEPRLEKLKQYKGVFSPQFSTYTEMPLALQLFQIFRSRWAGAYLQSRGIKVVPTMYWGEPASYWFCFDGIEKGTTVAVSTLGVRRQKDLFMQGYEEMVKRLEPETIICYSTPFEEMKGNIIAVDYQKTNNLTAQKKELETIALQKWTSGYVTKNIQEPQTKQSNEKYFGGYIVTLGMGSAFFGNREGRKRSFVKIDSNKKANKIAKELGFKDMHDLKKYYVSKGTISQFDLAKDLDNNSYCLINKTGTIIVPIE